MYDYVELVRQLGYEFDTFEITATRAKNFTIEFEGQFYSFPYQNESQLTAPEILKIMASSLPLLTSPEVTWACCFNGIVSILLLF